MKTQNTLRFEFTTRHLAGGLLAAILCLWPTLTRAETPVQAWVQRYIGPTNSSDLAPAVAVDASNNVIVAASSYGGASRDDYLTIKYSSAGVPLWTNHYNGTGNGDDYARAVAADGSNNVIVTGTSWGDGTCRDYATIKYSSAGAQLWARRYNGPANNTDGGWAVAVDHSNNVIVTGYSWGTESGWDYVTIKYSSAGAQLWGKRYNGPGNANDYINAVAVDGSNNVIVTGESFRDGSGRDYTTIKYSSAGAQLWATRYNGPGNGVDYATALAVDGSDDVIVTGTSTGSEATRDYTTIKYSSAGVPLWTNRYNGTGNRDDYAYAVAVDSSNNVIVTGESWGGGSGWDYATIKYSSAGVPLWTNRYDGPGNGTDYGWAVAVDTSNNVIVTGGSWDSGSGRDYTTIKYSSAGVPLWTNRYNGPANKNDGPRGMAVDRNNNVIVTGYSWGGRSYSDFATLKYVCVPSPVLTALNQTNGTFQLRVDEVLQPGTLVIEASTNLADWASLFTNTTPTNVLFYTDPDASNRLWRFYRAFQVPQN